LKKLRKLFERRTLNFERPILNTPALFEVQSSISLIQSSKFKVQYPLFKVRSSKFNTPTLFKVQCSTFNVRCLLAFFLAVSLFGQTQSDLDTQRLHKISQQEQKIYRQLETNPDFYTAEDLEHKLGEIILAYSNYLSENPDDVSALILYGKLLRQLGENERAFKAFLKADALDPDIAVVKQQIGNHLVETGNGKAALTFYLNAVELEPEVPEYNYALGEILHVFRDEFTRDQLFTRDSLDREMLKAFQATARLNPENFDVQMRLGEAYYDLATPDWKAALLHWEKLRKTTPDYNELRGQILDLHRARVLAKLGRKEEASELARGITQPGLQTSKEQILEEMARHDR
jgi:tetratricopeptide (TPR) repeat protein